MSLIDGKTDSAFTDSSGICTKFTMTHFDLGGWGIEEERLARGRRCRNGTETHTRQPLNSFLPVDSIVISANEPID